VDLPVHPIDIACVLYALYALIKGIRRGLASELARLVGFLGIFLVAWWFYPTLGETLLATTRLEHARSANLLAFVLLLAGAYLVFLAIRLLLKLLIDFKFKGAVEKIGGGLCGLARAALFVTLLLIVVFLGGQGVVYDYVAERSRVGEFFDLYTVPTYENAALTYPDLHLPLPEDPVIEDEIGPDELEDDTGGY
jgi:uncharacterized membrane protein required for colicin V production